MFQRQKQQIQKELKNYKSLNTVLKSVDCIIIKGVTSTSITLSITGVGLILLPISAGTVCTLSLGHKIIHKLLINKHNKYKKQKEKNQLTIKSFDKLYRRTLQDKIIDKSEKESLCNNFTKYVGENKNDFV